MGVAQGWRVQWAVNAGILEIGYGAVEMGEAFSV